MGFPSGSVVKGSPAMQELWEMQELQEMQELRELQVDPCVGKTPERRAWQSTPVFLPSESHGQRSLVGYSS